MNTHCMTKFNENNLRHGLDFKLFLRIICDVNCDLLISLPNSSKMFYSLVVNQLSHPLGELLIDTHLITQNYKSLSMYKFSL